MEAEFDFDFFFIFKCKKERKKKLMNKVGTRWKVKERKSFYQCLKKAKIKKLGQQIH